MGFVWCGIVQGIVDLPTWAEVVVSLDVDIVIAALPAYEVGEELGRGAYGIVLAGTHTTLDRAVAIKQLPRAFGADPHLRRRFLAEARVLASMDHPHIVPIFDFVEKDGICLLVMEHLSGGTLWTRMKAGDLDDRFAVATTLAAAAGLEYAQRRGVLHRDIKPENLMFSGDGVLKVTDFGIAKVVGGGMSMATKAGYALGTPAYMSPEQAQGIELGPATDVYALGTVLFEMLAGRLPYPTPTDPVVSLYQHVHEDPQRLAELAPAIHPAICEVTDRAIARSLDERWATPEDFKVALATAAETAWGARWASAPSLPLRELTAMPPASGGAASTILGVPPAPPVPPEPGTPNPAAGDTSPRRRAVVVAGALAVVVAGGVGAALTLGGGSGNGGSTTTTASTASAAEAPAVMITVDPPSGPVGTPLTVTSTSPCPAPPEGTTGPMTVYLRVLDPRQAATESGSEIFGLQYDVTADRSWNAQFLAPANATVGELSINVECLGDNPEFETDTPYYVFPNDGLFTITDGAAAGSGTSVSTP